MNTICISHSEDVDGLVSAAYLKHLKGSVSILISYDEMKDTLSEIEPPVKKLYICDLGIRKELLNEIFRIKKFADITIFDHHSTSREVLEKVKRKGITVIYSDLDCTSVLIYDKFKEKLSSKAKRLAAYAAISDQFEKGPIASKLISRFDKNFIQHEALILTHALDHENTEEVRIKISVELNRFDFPHKNKWVVDSAMTHLDYLAKLTELLPLKAKRLGRIAYFDGENERSIGTISSLLINAMDVEVGLCFKRREDGTANISIRGKDGIKIHLGKTTKKLAERYDGYGGGHKKASGAKIIQDNLLKFISDLANEIDC